MISAGFNTHNSGFLERFRKNITQNFFRYGRGAPNPISVEPTELDPFRFFPFGLLKKHHLPNFYQRSE